MGQSPEASPGSSPEISTEIAAIRERYAQERAKRLRPEGKKQYRSLTGEMASFLEDPYTPRVEREPVFDEVEVAVLGGGWGGLLCAARLREIGVDRLRVVEKGGDFGGTWYWNRYPGAGCDTEAYIYMPLLEETGYIPSQKYVLAGEMLEHAQRIGNHFRLYDDALLGTSVTDLRWSDDDQRWTISTDRGDRFRAQFVCMTMGPTTSPKLPGIPGIEDFRGHMFHTMRWDYDYTGGGPEGELTNLHDKRVAVIGTGATTMQCVPPLAQDSEHLYVFQRTPSAVSERNNAPTDPGWATSLQPGWQRDRMRNFSAFIEGRPVETDLVNDGWTSIFRARSTGTSPGVLDEVLDYRKMEEVRARVDALVEDPEVAAALKPWYRALCKRPTFHDEYLQTFNRPNVTLVDTNGEGVERITEHGIVANGVEHAVDCIIIATGFHVAMAHPKRLGYEAHGRNGQPLAQKWRQGMVTLYGTQVPDFPNLFLIGGISHVGIDSNQTHVLDVQSRHVARIVRRAREVGATTIDVTESASADWAEQVYQASRANFDFLISCTPGYYNNEGQPNVEAMRRNGSYSPGISHFNDIIDEWADDGMPGLLLDGVPAERLAVQPQRVST